MIFWPDRRLLPSLEQRHQALRSAHLRRVVQNNQSALYMLADLPTDQHMNVPRSGSNAPLLSHACSPDPLRMTGSQSVCCIGRGHVVRKITLVAVTTLATSTAARRCGG